MRKLTLALFTLTFILVMLCGCGQKDADGDVTITDTPAPTVNPETTPDATAPLIFEGEELYEKWVYAFADIDGNSIDERVSFLYVVKDKESNEITARIVVERDFAQKGSKDAILIERTSATLITPDELYVSVTDEGALIAVTDKHSPNGDDVYLFKYVKQNDSGMISEAGFDTGTYFPADSIGDSSVLSGMTYTVLSRDNKYIDITISGQTFTYELDLSSDTVLAAHYDMKLNTKDLVMTYEPDSCMVFIGTQATLYPQAEENDSMGVITTDAVISLVYKEGKLGICDFSLLRK